MPIDLRSRRYYLDYLTDAERVTRCGDLLLDGDTATDTSEGKYKTGNFTGGCCCSSLGQFYLVCFVFMPVKFNGKFKLYSFKF